MLPDHHLKVDMMKELEVLRMEREEDEEAEKLICPEILTPVEAKEEVEEEELLATKL